MKEGNCLVCLLQWLWWWAPFLWFGVRDVPFLSGCWAPLCQSTNSWGWVLTSGTWLSAGEGTWGICFSGPGCPLHSGEVASRGVLVFQLRHSSRLGYATSVSSFLHRFCKLKGVFSNSLTFYCLLWLKIDASAAGNLIVFVQTCILGIVHVTSEDLLFLFR